MQNCLNCIEYTSTNCIRPELELSFEYAEGDFNDLLLKLDDSNNKLKKLLSKNIDKKWIKADYEFITDYIQDIINKIDVLSNLPTPAEEKYIIPSEILGSQEKNLTQILTVLVKEVDALKKKVNSQTSSIYTPNV